MIRNIDGININYIIEGEGDPIMVLHGWGANIDTVLPIVNILKDKYKVYALDLPGFGKSDRPKDVFDSFDYAKLVKSFMEEEGVNRADFIGHSFGGKISLIFGSKYKEVVNRIVLIDSAGLIPKRGAKYYIKVYGFKSLRFIYKNFFFWLNHEEKMEKFYKRFGSSDYRDADGIIRKILVKVVNENLQPFLKEIEAPTLLIWGEEDDATPLYMAKIMEREIPNSGLVLLKGGHYSYIDDYYKFKAVLREFFK